MISAIDSVGQVIACTWIFRAHTLDTLQMKVQSIYSDDDHQRAIRRIYASRALPWWFTITKIIIHSWTGDRAREKTSSSAINYRAVSSSKLYTGRCHDDKLCSPCYCTHLASPHRKRWYATCIVSLCTNSCDLHTLCLQCTRGVNALQVRNRQDKKQARASETRIVTLNSRL